MLKDNVPLMRVLHRPGLPPVLWLVLVVTAAALARQAPADDTSCRIGASAGARRYRPGSWGMVEVIAANATDQAAELFAVLHFAADPTLQFGRRICVPPKSLLRSTCPIRVPETLAADAGHADIVTAEIDEGQGRERMRRPGMQAMLNSHPILLDHETPAVGMLGDFDSGYRFGDGRPYFAGPERTFSAPDDPAYELVLAAKRTRGLSRRVSAFDAGEPPADPAGLEVLDVLVLSTNRLASNPSGAALVRDWVLAGGHLWIMLDDVEEETVSVVLGDAFTSTVVDRVGLTRVRIENARPDWQRSEAPELELEEPVAFARVIPRGVVVTDTVDGWPAAFHQPLGAGRVFFTALGPAGWMRPTAANDPKPKTKGDQTGFVARDSLLPFANECILRRPAPGVPSAAMEPFLTSQIGYRILSRGAVAGVLAAFCAAVLVAGLGFSRAGRLEWLVWLSPLAAATTSLVFLGVAASAKRSVPPAVATLQMVVLEPGTATGHVSGLAAIYNPDACDSSMGASRGGRFFPDMTGMSGRRRRMVWTDEGAWHWENLSVPPGVRTAPLAIPLPLEETVDCRARFGPKGLEGTLGPLPFTSLSDAVISVPRQPAAAVRIRGDGSFTSEAGDVLAPGEFMSTAWLTDLKQRRRSLYQELFRAGPTPSRPLLYAWADAVDSGFLFPQRNQFGSALISVAVRMERPLPGTRILVPASFIPYRSVTSPDGRNPSAYNNTRHEWVEKKTAHTEWLRFQLPEAALPLQVEQAALRFEVKAPSRSFEIMGYAEGRLAAVTELSHPIGAYQSVIDRPEMLRLDAEGGWLMAIRVGDDQSATRDIMSQATWTIDSLQLEIVGTVPGE